MARGQVQQMLADTAVLDDAHASAACCASLLQVPSQAGANREWQDARFCRPASAQQQRRVLQLQRFGCKLSGRAQLSAVFANVPRTTASRAGGAQLKMTLTMGAEGLLLRSTRGEQAAEAAARTTPSPQLKAAGRHRSAMGGTHTPYETHVH